MSRRNRHQRFAPPLSVERIVTPAGDIGLVVELGPHRLPAEAKIAMVAAEMRCDRLVQHDSLRWSCACGASGPVGRSKDGMPYANDEVLAHAPGEQRS